MIHAGVNVSERTRQALMDMNEDLDVHAYDSARVLAAMVAEAVKRADSMARLEYALRCR